jgi:hypothetical protein
MPFVSAQPAELTAAADNLQGAGWAMTSQNAAAAVPTTGVVPAAADEVSALTAAQFATHAEMYQVISAQAAAIHQMFRQPPGRRRRFLRGPRGRKRRHGRLGRQVPPRCWISPLFLLKSIRAACMPVRGPVRCLPLRRRGSRSPRN